MSSSLSSKKHVYFKHDAASFLCLCLDLFLTKVFYWRARLIRFPLYCRGSKHVDFGSNLTTGRYCRIDALSMNSSSEGDAGPLLKIIFGSSVQIGDRVHLASGYRLVIGSKTLIASNVFITDHDHGSTDYEALSIEPAERRLLCADVVIGESCWIGQNVCILKGVHLGNNSVVAAGAVVTRSFPPFSVIGGIPARLLKSIS